MPLSLRLAEDHVDAVLIFRALKAMHDEDGVPGEFIPIKVLTRLMRVINGPGDDGGANSAALMAMDGDELVGFLLLWEETFWFNESKFLGDKGLYVLPEHRGGDAGKLLLQGAIDASDDCGLPVFITINNGRRKRGSRSPWERVGATLGYTPRGATMAHFPKD